MDFCCKNLDSFQEAIKEKQENSLQKEDQTQVLLEHRNKKNVLAIEHPLFELPGLVFNFCPYCGQKQKKRSA